jgi:hypothetical protein
MQQNQEGYQNVHCPIRSGTQSFCPILLAATINQHWHSYSPRFVPLSVFRRKFLLATIIGHKGTITGHYTCNRLVTSVKGMLRQQQPDRSCAIAHVPAGWVSVNEKPHWPVQRDWSADEQPKRTLPKEENRSNDYCSPKDGERNGTRHNGGIIVGHRMARGKVTKARDYHRCCEKEPKTVVPTHANPLTSPTSIIRSIVNCC